MATSAFGAIQVPLDGSATAGQALPVAGAIAHRSGARLHLATVHVPMPILLSSGEDAALDYDLDRELRAQLETYLASTRAKLSAEWGIEVTGAVLDLHGTVARTLSDEAHAVGAGLVVMTTHGHGGVKRLWLGSVADGVLRHVQVPVLLLRSGEGAPPTEFQTIVVGLDGSLESEQVLEPVVTLGSLEPDARYTLVQVVEPPVSIITRMAMQPAPLRPHWREQQENSARAYLERVATRLRGRGCTVATQVMAGRGVGEQILDFARECRAELVAVGTHGARGVERLLVGSVADKVIRGAVQPVLVVPTLVKHEGQSPRAAATA